MRMYIVVGAIGSGITETCRDIWEGLFEKNLRSARRVFGRPDNVIISDNVIQDQTPDELIAMISASLDALPGLGVNDVIISGTRVNKHALAIRNHWANESKIIFIRKADRARAIDAGMMLLEHRSDFNQEAYAAWIANQVDSIDQTVASLGLEWKNTLVNSLNSVEFSLDDLSANSSMTENTFTIAENTNELPAGSVPRQFSIY